jgi:hypothetical protein
MYFKLFMERPPCAALFGFFLSTSRSGLAFPASVHLNTGTGISCGWLKEHLQTPEKLEFLKD